MSSRATVGTALAALTLLVVATGSAAAAPQAGTATQAVHAGHASRIGTGSFPDPGFARFSSRYYLYRTGGDIGVTSSARAQSGYGAVRTAMSRRPAWVSQHAGTNPQLWAPDVFDVRTGSGTVYVMYYTGIYPETGLHCIGVATSSRPGGGFADRNTQPLTCSGRAGYEAIDPSAYRAPNGKRYLLYKVDYRNTRNFEIRALPMDSATGTVTIGASRSLISSASSKIEAPSAIDHGGSVWLFTARGSYTDCSYSTDVWRASSLWGGRFARVRTVLSSASTGLCGPGGATVLADGATTRIAFHAWHGGTLATHGVRQAWVGVLRWNRTGPYLY